MGCICSTTQSPYTGGSHGSSLPAASSIPRRSRHPADQKLSSAGAAAAAREQHPEGKKPVVSVGGDAERRRMVGLGVGLVTGPVTGSGGISVRVPGVIPKADQAEQVAAGWPPWLAEVAGDAIRGWVPRRADAFEKLDKIGQGTYSNVYRARDLDKNKIVALKKVRFDTLEPESVRFMAREIRILRRLDHPNIIKLEGLITSRMSSSLYLIFEYMEHDLSGLASFAGQKFSEPQIKCYMRQLLRGLDHCHSRGVLHRDIKGSNLLVDNCGILKIADFGLANFFGPEQRQPLTSRVVTLWYRPPELLLGATNYDVAVDLWSSGCILAELYAGKPIMPGRTEVEQLHKIFKLCGSPSEDYWKASKLPNATIFKPQRPYKRCVTETFKELPAPALALVDILLSINPSDRITAASALQNEFFMTEPLPCDPSSLPRYPPSKELDAKRREDGARSQVTAGSKKQIANPEKLLREYRGVAVPDANAELASSMKKWQAQGNSKSRSEMFNQKQEDAGSGFRIEPPERALVEAEDSLLDHSRKYFSGPLVNQTGQLKPRRTDNEVTGFPSKVPSVMPPRLGAAACDGIKRSGNAEAKHVDAESTSYCDQQQHEEMSVTADATSGRGIKGNNIHYSGPLLRPSVNVDQALKDHDRQMQEVVRRAKADKSRIRKLQADFVPIVVYPSSREYRSDAH